ncbi:hypothetical protein ACLPHM_05850 [Paenalcaligenes sp. Me131]|uniref:hypothetical protein n=1 Tax=Paenalcaligenes sp. Me131 TaxID=3392636 RepID=UPI003D2DA02B
MAIKKGNAPKSFPAELELVGGGESIKLKLTYHNRKPSELENWLKDLEGSSAPFMPSMVVYLVKDMEADYSLSLEGIMEMEDERPGICDAIIAGFHQTRRTKLQGN